MGRQVFTAGEILTAANMNDLSDQSVMVFDDDAARATAIPTPVEGMLTYLEDVGGAQGLEVFDGSDFVPVAIEPDPPAILQVAQSVKTASQSTSATTFQDVTDLSVTITPGSATSKILVMVDFMVGSSLGGEFLLEAQLVRNGTQIGGGFANTLGQQNLRSQDSATKLVLDSPGTTSATTYKLQFRARGSFTVFIGRTGDNSVGPFATITAMEVAG